MPADGRDKLDSMACFNALAVRPAPLLVLMLASLCHASDLARCVDDPTCARSTAAMWNTAISLTNVPRSQTLSPAILAPRGPAGRAPVPTRGALTVASRELVDNFKKVVSFFGGET